jgi:hypothetical protein
VSLGVREEKRLNTTVLEDGQTLDSLQGFRRGILKTIQKLKERLQTTQCGNYVNSSVFQRSDVRISPNDKHHTGIGVRLHAFHTRLRSCRWWQVLKADTIQRSGNSTGGFRKVISRILQIFCFKSNPLITQARAHRSDMKLQALYSWAPRKQKTSLLQCIRKQRLHCGQRYKQYMQSRMSTENSFGSIFKMHRRFYKM